MNIGAVNSPTHVGSGWWEIDQCPACRESLGQSPEEHLVGTLFCDECDERSRAHSLTDWDDIGVGD